MRMTHELVDILEHEPIGTWFGVGGAADRHCRPGSVEAVAAAMAWAREHGERLRVLGDGANLLVDDDGVDGLVLDTRELNAVEIDETMGKVRAGAGARLPQLINETVRAGLGGLEVLAGIPASVGGAAVMNAGGRFGSIADRVRTVEAVDPVTCHPVTLERREIEYGYRRSGLGGLVVVGVEFALEPASPESLRARLLECMAYKKKSQPLKADSAGCCFKNPVLGAPVDGIGSPGDRVSAGLLLDRAGCKGMREGGAEVSAEHANFLVTEKGGRARDVIALMDRAAARVREAFGVELEREVVVWGQGEESAR